MKTKLGKAHGLKVHIGTLAKKCEIHRAYQEAQNVCKGCGKKASDFSRKDKFSEHVRKCLEKRGEDEFVEADAISDFILLQHDTPTNQVVENGIRDAGQRKQQKQQSEGRTTVITM